MRAKSTPAARMRSMMRSYASSHIRTGEVTSPGSGPRIAPFVVPYDGRSRSKCTEDSWTSVPSESMRTALRPCVERSRPRKRGSSTGEDMSNESSGEMRLSGMMGKEKGKWLSVGAVGHCSRFIRAGRANVQLVRGCTQRGGQGERPMARGSLRSGEPWVSHRLVQPSPPSSTTPGSPMGLVLIPTRRLLGLRPFGSSRVTCTFPPCLHVNKSK